MMNPKIATALKDWIPYRLKENGDNPYCEWLYLGNNQFDRPFFEETIAQCKCLAENSKLKRSVSNTAILNDWAGAAENIKPNAIIFHVSRCGSTLLSQLLATHSSNIVLSEVPFFDEILRMGFRKGAMDKTLPLLHNAVRLYGIKRLAEQQHLFIKADSWHIHFYNELRSLYPNIPFLLLYRRPDEVIRSQQKERGMHAVPGFIEPEVFGFLPDAAFSTNLDEYMARVLETYYASFTSILKQDRLAFAFDYKEGMLSIAVQMMKKCNIQLSEKQIAAMQKRSEKHSKYPGQVFSEAPLTNAPPAYMEKAFQLYHQLENYRITHRPTS